MGHLHAISPLHYSIIIIIAIISIITIIINVIITSESKTENHARTRPQTEDDYADLGSRDKGERTRGRRRRENERGREDERPREDKRTRERDGCEKTRTNE